MNKMVTRVLNRKLLPTARFTSSLVGQLGLKRHLLTELDQMLNVIQTTELSDHAELVETLLYAKGIVRGMEVAGAVTRAQSLSLLDVLEAAYVERNLRLRQRELCICGPCSPPDSRGVGLGRTR